MFNENRKRSFINEYAGSERVALSCRRVFEISSEYESRIGVDLCDLDLDDLQPVIDDIAGFRAFDTDVYIRIILAYIDWCEKHGSHVSDAIFSVDTDGITKMKKQTVTGPKQLSIYLDALFKNDEMHTHDCVFRMYMWLAFSGLSENEALSVREKDLSLNTMSVSIKGKTYPIYRESISSLNNCIRLKQFKTYVSTYTNIIRVWDRATGDYILRTTNPIPQRASYRNSVSIAAKAAEDSGKTDKSLSFYRAWISGVFYRAYEEELAGLGADFYDLARNDVLSSAKEGTTELAKRNRISKTARLYARDYERWKRTFQK